MGNYKNINMEDSFNREYGKELIIKINWYFKWIYDHLRRMMIQVDSIEYLESFIFNIGILI